MPDKAPSVTQAGKALLPGRGFDTDALLAPEQALTLFFAHAAPARPATEFVALDAAFGRILAVPVTADAPYPAGARSAMDGYAVRASDLPGTLRIAGAISMGAAWPQPLQAGTAVRIPTGGLLPPGADAVVPVEDAQEREDEVAVARAVPAGDCVTPPGSDMRAGERILQAGRRIGGPELGLLATLGLLTVPVYRRPVVAVISSGDELVPVGDTPGPAQVRDSNRWAIDGTLRALGASVLHVPRVPDVPERLEAALVDALARADAVILSGGSSVGEADWTPRTIARLGPPGVIVHGLRVKPGKPTVLACIGAKPVIGLPGNPASTLLVLEAVGAPIVCALTGGSLTAAVVPAVLAAPVEKRAGWTWFVPARLEPDAGLPRAVPLPVRSSSASLAARASGYLAIGEDVERLEAGTRVDLRPFAVGCV